MIFHQPPGPDAKAGLLAGFAEGLEKKFLILAVGGDENGIEAIAARHDVVESAGEFDTDLSGDGGGWQEGGFGAMC